MDMTIPDETLIRLLPASCRLLLQEGMALPDVLALIRHYGGGSLCVPCAVDESSELAQAIGLEPARKLVAKCRDSQFYVPHVPALERYRRDVAILRAYDVGTILRDIARAHRVSERTVSYVAARHGRPKRLNRCKQPNANTEASTPPNRTFQE